MHEQLVDEMLDTYSLQLKARSAQVQARRVQRVAFFVLCFALGLALVNVVILVVLYERLA